MGFALIAMLLVAHAAELPFLDHRGTAEHASTAGGSCCPQCQEELSRLESRCESRCESRWESRLARERESWTRAAAAPPLQGSAVAPPPPGSVDGRRSGTTSPGLLPLCDHLFVQESTSESFIVLL